MIVMFQLLFFFFTWTGAGAQSFNVTDVMRMPKYAGASFRGDNTVFERELEYGVRFNVFTAYRPIKSVGYKYIDTKGKQLQLVTEFFNCGDIFAIANGSCDSHVTKLAKDIATVGKTVWIRQFHEFNFIKTYPWCLQPYTDEKIAAFRRAWIRTVNIYRKEKAPVKFQLCYMAGNPIKDKHDYADFYPGSNFVDQVGFDIYINAAKKLPLPTFKQRMDTGIYEAAKAFDKPLFIGEVSCTEHGLNRTTWIRDAWKSITDEYKQIRVVNWFLIDKGEPRQWDLHTAEQKRVWVEGYKYYMNNQ
jgi:Glycosyl hydrolase family 26